MVRPVCLWMESMRSTFLSRRKIRPGAAAPMRRVRRHLTYANVMATLAVFLVLAGGTALGAYVITSNSQVGPGTISGHRPQPGDQANIIRGSINTGDLAPHSVGNAKLTQKAVGTSNFAAGALAPRAAVSNRTAQLLVSHARRNAKLKRRASAAAAGDSGSLVRISVGETQTLIAKDPFTVTAQCIDRGGNAVAMKMFVNSSVAGSVVAASNIGFTTFGPGDPVEFWNTPGGFSNSYYVNGAGLSAAAPTGDALNIGAVQGGYHLFGSDCAVSLFGVG